MSVDCAICKKEISAEDWDRVGVVFHARFALGFPGGKPRIRSEVEEVSILPPEVELEFQAHGTVCFTCRGLLGRGLQKVIEGARHGVELPGLFGER